MDHHIMVVKLPFWEYLKRTTDNIEFIGEPFVLTSVYTTLNSSEVR